MAYRRTDNTDRITSEMRNKKVLAIRFMLDAIHREARPKTPMLTGQLRGDVIKRISGSKGSIRWGKKYAWYQERGYTSGRVRRYTTAGTGAHFAENAVKTVTKDARRYFKQAGL
jgi:hypothetical protein